MLDHVEAPSVGALRGCERPDLARPSVARLSWPNYPLDLAGAREAHAQRGRQLERRYREALEELRERRAERLSQAGLNVGIPIALLLITLVPLVVWLGVLALQLALAFALVLFGAALVLVLLALVYGYCGLGLDVVMSAEEIEAEQLENIERVHREGREALEEEWSDRLARHRRCETELRGEHQDFGDGTGGFDLFIRELGLSERDLELLRGSFREYAAFLYDFIDDANTTLGVNTRWSTWKERRERDRKAGRPTSLLEQERQLDQVRIERAREVFAKADSTIEDVEIVEYLEAVEQDTGLARSRTC